MGVEKNIIMKQFNGTDYDILYPKTTADQISGVMPIASGGTNGSTAPSSMNNLVSGLSQITRASNDLFPFKDVSGNTGGSVTLANLAIALGNNGVITSSNLAAQASALGFAKIQTGSYVGTGTYGSSAPCSLTFDFVPKLVIIQGTGTASSISNDYKIVALNGINTASSLFFENLNTNVGWFLMVAITWNGNTMQWYALDGYQDVKASSSSQLNSNNNTYYYIALG